MSKLSAEELDCNDKNEIIDKFVETFKNLSPENYCNQFRPCEANIQTLIQRDMSQVSAQMCLMEQYKFQDITSPKKTKGVQTLSYWSVLEHSLDYRPPSESGYNLEALQKQLTWTKTQEVFALKAGQIKDHLDIIIDRIIKDKNHSTHVFTFHLNLQSQSSYFSPPTLFS